MHNETIPAPLLHHGPDRNQEHPPGNHQVPADSPIVIKLVVGALIILIFFASLLR